MAGDDNRRTPTGGDPGAVKRDGTGEHHRLRVGGEVERFFRTLGNQFAQIKLQRLTSLGNGVPDDGIVGKTVQHANGLRTLTWKYKSEWCCHAGL